MHVEFRYQSVIPTKKTPLTKEQAREALRKAFYALTGAPPSENVLALLMAQSALETGHWESMHHYNWGGLKAYSSWDGERTSYPCSEYIKGKKTRYPTGNKHCIFRAYPNASEGAKDYLRILLRREDWKKGLLSGDPQKFNAALSGKSPRYYTAKPSKYGHALKRLFHKFRGVEPPSEDVKPIAVMAFGGLFAWMLMRKMDKS